MTNLSSFSSKRLRGCVAALGVLALTASCAVGPDFLRPRPPAVSGYTPGPLAKKTAAAPVAAGEAQSYAEGMDISHQWWEVFRSKQLNALLTQSLKNNPDCRRRKKRCAWRRKMSKRSRDFSFRRYKLVTHLPGRNWREMKEVIRPESRETVRLSPPRQTRPPCRRHASI